MIELFYPPKIEHKNAIKVKGSASMGERSEMSFNHWLKKKAKNEEKQAEREKQKLERAAELRKSMIEARKNYTHLLEKSQALRVELIRARKDMENRVRSYKRASLS